MRRLDDCLREEESFFGPGWDLAISLIAVLILTLAIEAAAHLSIEHQGQLEIRGILNSQMRLVDALAAHYGTARRDIARDTYGIFVRTASATPDITIHDEATLQRISFGGHVLFESDDTVLRPEGAAILRVLSATLQSELDHIMEIEIQGHADLLQPKVFHSNLELAARRAITVYQSLQSFGLDPSRSIMSATSFGEYVPVTRRNSDSAYSRAKLLLDNDTREKQRLNRRIEVVLIYR